MTAPWAEVIGDPITGSRSPIIHRFWLDRLGLPGRYERTRVTLDSVNEHLHQRRDDPDWRGCNVTMPLKAAVLDLIEDRGDLRGTIGACNTVLREPDGTLVGTNTDVAGFYAPLAEEALAGASVIVVGAGGGARAALFALQRMGVDEVTLFNRSPVKAVGLLASFGLKGRVLPLDAPLLPASLLVNASALGMTGQPAFAPDLFPLGPDAIVYDLVYSPLETPLLAAARVADLRTIDGLEMLVGQAAVAFELFFGAAPPRDEASDDELRALLLAS